MPYYKNLFIYNKQNIKKPWFVLYKLHDTEFLPEYIFIHAENYFRISLSLADNSSPSSPEAIILPSGPTR